jgi:hypothetical protein
VEVPIIIESPLTLEQPSQNLGESTGCSPIGIWFERFQALIGVFESIMNDENNQFELEEGEEPNNGIG